LNGNLMINGTAAQTQTAFGELNGTTGVSPNNFGRVMQFAGRINF